MPADIKELKKYWRQLIENSSYKGRIDDLSVEVGRSPAYLRGLLLNDITPKMDLVAPLAAALGVTPNELLQHGGATCPSDLADGIAEEVRQLVAKRFANLEPKLTGKDIMSWWARNGGRLEDCERFIEQVDIYSNPDLESSQVRTQRLGHKSLAARELGTASDDLFQRTIAPLGNDFRKRILVAHKSSLERGPVSSIETLNVAHADTGKQIAIQYMRTLAPVVMPDGSRCVLNYSELLG